ncbi:MAG: hypothetical protein RXR82_03325 [Nitrososphaeria archaeon]
MRSAAVMPNAPIASGTSEGAYDDTNGGSATASTRLNPAMVAHRPPISQVLPMRKVVPRDSILRGASAGPSLDRVSEYAAAAASAEAARAEYTRNGFASARTYADVPIATPPGIPEIDTADARVLVPKSS